MTELKPFPDFMGMFGLKPKKASAESKKYANFNRRMLAVAVDFFIVAILIAPVADWFITYYQGPPKVDMVALHKELQAISDEQERVRVYWRTMQETGAFQQWMDGTAIQMAVLLGLIGVCWHFWSATPGKMLVRIRVVDAITEEPISDMQILLRLAGYMVSAACFLAGFLWIGIDKKKQGWHDKIAGTTVIALPWKKGPIPGTQAAGPSDSQEPSKEA